ncbi:unnamed protein product, partial [Amoebophrya sp. A120]
HDVDNSNSSIKDAGKKSTTFAPADAKIMPTTGTSTSLKKSAPKTARFFVKEQIRHHSGPTVLAGPPPPTQQPHVEDNHINGDKVQAGTMRINNLVNSNIRTEPDQHLATSERIGAPTSSTSSNYSNDDVARALQLFPSPPDEFQNLTLGEAWEYWFDYVRNYEKQEDEDHHSDYRGPGCTTGKAAITTRATFFKGDEDHKQKINSDCPPPFPPTISSTSTAATKLYANKTGAGGRWLCIVQDKKSSSKVLEEVHGDAVAGPTRTTCSSSSDQSNSKQQAFISIRRLRMILQGRNVRSAAQRYARFHVTEVPHLSLNSAGASSPGPAGGLSCHLQRGSSTSSSSCSATEADNCWATGEHYNQDNANVNKGAGAPSIYNGKNGKMMMRKNQRTPRPEQFTLRPGCLWRVDGVQESADGRCLEYTLSFSLSTNLKVGTLAAGGATATTSTTCGSSIMSSSSEVDLQRRAEHAGASRSVGGPGPPGAAAVPSVVSDVEGPHCSAGKKRALVSYDVFKTPQKAQAAGNNFCPATARTTTFGEDIKGQKLPYGQHQHTRPQHNGDVGQHRQAQAPAGTTGGQREEGQQLEPPRNKHKAKDHPRVGVLASLHDWKKHRKIALKVKNTFFHVDEPAVESSDDEVVVSSSSTTTSRGNSSGTTSNAKTLHADIGEEEDQDHTTERRDQQQHPRLRPPPGRSPPRHGCDKQVRSRSLQPDELRLTSARRCLLTEFFEDSTTSKMLTPPRGRGGGEDAEVEKNAVYEHYNNLMSPPRDEELQEYEDSRYNWNYVETTPTALGGINDFYSSNSMSVEVEKNFYPHEDEGE